LPEEIITDRGPQSQAPRARTSPAPAMGAEWHGGPAEFDRVAPPSGNMEVTGRGTAPKPSGTPTRPGWQTPPPDLSGAPPTAGPGGPRPGTSHRRQAPSPDQGLWRNGSQSARQAPPPTPHPPEPPQANTRSRLRSIATGHLCQWTELLPSDLSDLQGPAIEGEPPRPDGRLPVAAVPRHVAGSYRAGDDSVKSAHTQRPNRSSPVDIGPRAAVTTRSPAGL
jgi:hypothetical protein